MGRNPRTWIRDSPAGPRVTLNQEARRVLHQDLCREEESQRHHLSGRGVRVTTGAGPRFGSGEVGGWAEAMARHPRWGELRLGCGTGRCGRVRRQGLTGLIEQRMAMGPGPDRCLEDHLDSVVPGLGSDLRRALRGCGGKRREAVRAAFALHGPRAAERLSQDPASLVEELLAAVQRLEGRTAGGRDPYQRREQRHGHCGDSHPGPRHSDPRRAEALATLGLPHGASPEAVKAAHRSLVKRHHPDRGGRAEDFHRITAAYRLLIHCAP